MPNDTNSAGFLRMDDSQGEMVFKGIEVAVAVQEDVSMQDAIRGDEAVDRLTNGLATSAKSSIVAGCFDCKSFSTRIEDIEMAEFRQHG